MRAWISALWLCLATAAAAQQWVTSGNVIFNGNSGSVGIGSIPSGAFTFEVTGSLATTGGGLVVFNQSNLPGNNGLLIAAGVPKNTAPIAGGGGCWRIVSDDATTGSSPPVEHWLQVNGCLITDSDGSYRRFTIGVTEQNESQRALTFQEAGGPVGIGTPRPGTIADSGANLLVVNSQSGSNGVTIQVPNGYETHFYMGSPSFNSDGAIVFDTSAHKMKLYAGGSDMFSFTNTGNYRFTTMQNCASLSTDSNGVLVCNH